MLVTKIPSYHHHHHLPTYPPKLYFAISQLPVVRFEHVRTLFDSTQSQESKSDIGLCKRMRQSPLSLIPLIPYPLSPYPPNPLSP